MGACAAPHAPGLLLQSPGRCWRPVQASPGPAAAASALAASRLTCCGGTGPAAVRALQLESCRKRPVEARGASSSPRRAHAPPWDAGLCLNNARSNRQNGRIAMPPAHIAGELALWGRRRLSSPAGPPSAGQLGMLCLAGLGKLIKPPSPRAAPTLTQVAPPAASLAGSRRVVCHSPQPWLPAVWLQFCHENNCWDATWLRCPPFPIYACPKSLHACIALQPAPPRLLLPSCASHMRQSTLAARNVGQVRVRDNLATRRAARGSMHAAGMGAEARESIGADKHVWSCNGAF